MGVSLSKGGNVSLTKEAPGLTAVTVGLGWDVRTTDRHRLRPRRVRDRCSTPSGKVVSDEHFVFFNNLKSARTARSSTPATTSPARARATTRRSRSTSPACRPTSTRSSSRSRSTTPTPAARASARSATRSSASSTQAGGAEIARYDLSEDASTETAMVFGELYRNGAEWKFRAVGQGYASGLRGHRPGLRRQRLAGSRALEPTSRRAGPSARLAAFVTGAHYQHMPPFKTFRIPLGVTIVAIIASFILGGPEVGLIVVLLTSSRSRSRSTTRSSTRTSSSG